MTNNVISGLVVALLVYLGLEAGGFDLLVWGEAGAVVWWTILLGAAVGLLPRASVGRSGWLVLGTFAAFACWLALAITWAESSERAVAEAARVVTYIGVLVLALFLARGGRARAVFNGVACGLAVIGILALLSRLHPAWFPEDEAVGILAERDRLDYPLDYFNGLAALLGLAIVLQFGVSSAAWTRAGRAAAAASLPALGLALYMTVSRGGVLAAAVGVATFLLIGFQRLPKIATACVAVGASALLMLAFESRSALDADLRNSAARSEGDELLLLTLVVCAAVALAHVGIELATRRGWFPRIRPLSTAARAGAAAGLAAVVALGLFGLGGGAALSDAWDEFREPPNLAGGERRFASAASRGRYQIWQSAVDANKSATLEGIGPGGFEFWWAREGRMNTYVRDGHSLYLESLAELGVVGLLLIALFIGSVLWAGARRALRREEDHLLLAAATAGCAAFAVSAAVDWVWELTVMPIAFMALAGVVAGGAAARPIGERRPGPVPRAVLAGLAVAALIVLAGPLVAANSVRDSEKDVAAGRLEDALDSARTAERAQSYAATPKLQRALVLERIGDLDQAAASARAATRAESTNWQPWAVLSRIESRRNRPAGALAAYRRAASLNPRSRLFARGG